MASVGSQKGSELESSHVHQVYDQIASHFALTRYKPWPIVERFLSDLTDGSVGLDVGCGNGKYLRVNPNIFIVASDRSEKLIKFALKDHPHAPIIADNLYLPHPPSFFDFAISIAVVHHFSTPARRVEAIAAILEILRPTTKRKTGDGIGYQAGGRALIYVWALEQKNSRRGWDVGDDQDVMVPWVLKQKTEDGKEVERTLDRYYHLYRHGELEQDIVSAGGEVVDYGYEKDNWWAIAVRKP